MNTWNGKPLPTGIDVENGKQYAVVAATQITFAHFLWPLIGKLLLIPGLIAALFGIYFAYLGSQAMMLMVTHNVIVARDAALLVALCLFGLLIYLLAQGVKRAWRWLMVDMRINYTGGYKGPFNARSVRSQK